MDEWFTELTRAVEGTPAIAVGAAFVWGVLSVVLSPCHLASIPLVVAFTSGKGVVSNRRAFLIATLFAAGILVTIGAVGAITAAAGRMLGDIGTWTNYVVAAVLIVVGLCLLDVIPVPRTAGLLGGTERRGPLGAFVLGLLFGAALGPCTFAFMAPILGVVFQVATASVAYSVVLLLSFGIGHCAVIVVAGTSANLVQRYLDWNERSAGTVIARRICGVLVLLGALYLIYKT